MNERDDEVINLRPITLEEYVGRAIHEFPKLEKTLGVRLEALLWKEAHPLREFSRQVFFRIGHWRWWIRDRLR